MKKIVIILLAILVVAFFVGCGRTSSSEVDKNTSTTSLQEPEDATWGPEVLPDVFDNGRGSAYIRFLQPTGEVKSAACVRDLLNRKDDWQKRFPNKRLVSISIVYGPADGHLQAINFVIGMAICYEETPSK